MNIYDKKNLLIDWIRNLYDESALDSLISEYLDGSVERKSFSDFSYECQYNVLPLEPDVQEHCERMNRECCEKNCPLWKTFKRIAQRNE